jgi:hypothetical protein
MSSNGGAFFSTLLRNFTGLNVAADSLSGKFNNVRKAAIGAGVALGGLAALRGIADLVGDARDLNRELVRTNQLGGAFSTTLGQARSQAFSASSAVPTFTAAQMVKFQRELGTQLNSPEAGFALAPLAAKAAYVASNYTKESPENMIKNLIKVVDLRAQIFSKDASGREVVDPIKVAAELNAAVKGLMVGGGYIKSNDLLQMARLGGVPVKGMTPEAYYATMVEMAVSQGASRTGVGLTSLFSQFVGGKMTVQTATEMQRMGLLSRKEWHSDHGHVVTSLAASMRFVQALKDPDKFITGELNSRMNNQHFTDAQKLAEVFRLYGKQTTQRIIQEAISGAPQFARSRSMFHVIPDIDAQFKAIMAMSYDANVTSMSTAWKNFTAALGSAGTPMAITMLQGMTSVLQRMTAFANAHPELTRWIMGIAAGLAALSVVGGTIAVATIAFGALGGALGSLAAVAPAMAILAGPLGLLGLALGIQALGKAFPSIPGWLIRVATGAAVGGAVGSVIPGAGTLAGAVAGGAGAALWGVADAPNSHRQNQAQGSTPANPVHVAITNAHGLAYAITNGLAGGLSSASSGPTGPSPILMPQLPGH